MEVIDWNNVAIDLRSRISANSNVTLLVFTTSKAMQMWKIKYRIPHNINRIDKYEWVALDRPLMLDGRRYKNFKVVE